MFIFQSLMVAIKISTGEKAGRSNVTKCQNFLRAFNVLGTLLGALQVITTLSLQPYWWGNWNQLEQASCLKSELVNGWAGVLVGVLRVHSRALTEYAMLLIIQWGEFSHWKLIWECLIPLCLLKEIEGRLLVQSFKWVQFIAHFRVAWFQFMRISLLCLK